MTNLVLVAIVTAYTWTGDRCADGHWPTNGTVAAPANIPFGTRVKIAGTMVVS